MSKRISPDTVLDIVGNETRRRILSLLASKSRYLSQLSRELGDVSITGVKRQVELLEEIGLISPLGDSGAAPEKRYYALRTPIQLTLNLSPRGLEVKLGTESSLEDQVVIEKSVLPVEFSENLNQALAKLNELRIIVLSLKKFISAQSDLKLEANFNVRSVEDFLRESNRAKSSSPKKVNTSS